MRVVLTYLDGVSNWGPNEASGVMEFVRQEGEVRLSGRGLPAAPNQHYVLWLVRDGSADVYRLGEPTVRADGTLTLDLVLPQDIPDRGWNLAIVTVEDTPNPSHPGSHRSMAGRFPQLLPNGTLPKNLPNTGLGGGGASSIGAGLWLIVITGVAVSVFFCLKRKRRSS